MSVLEAMPMAKKGRPPKPMGRGTQVRIDSDLARMARYIATQRDLELIEYLSAILRPAVLKEFRAIGKEIEG
jgi:hypothetical protein